MIKNNTIRKEWPLPQDHYCANNFNNLGRAFVVLFDLLVVNQWHVLTEGFVVAAASRWVRLTSPPSLSSSTSSQPLSLR
jgi:hypothetical protein